MSLVEVVIGAIMISLVLMAVVMTLTSAGQAQQRSKVRQQMTGSADGTLEALRADKAWVAPSLSAPTCATHGCPIVLDAATTERVTKGKDGRVFEVLATGWPVDSDGDGIGPADTDRIVPDYVRVSVRVSMSAAQQEQFGTQKPFTIVSTIDMAQHAGATGTLTVQTCEVTDQIDERAAIDGCDIATSRALEPQPGPCRANPLLPFNALTASDASLALDCNTALDGADNSPHARMSIRPVTNLGFQIVQITPEGSRLTRRGADADIDTRTGRYTFTNLPAGTWKFEAITPAPGREHWASKAVPSALSVSVPANAKAKALLVQRVVQARGTQTVNFTRTVYTYETIHPGDVFLEKGTIWGMWITTGIVFVHDMVVREGTPTRQGTAYDGIVGTEAKPAGRYVDQITGNPAQRRIPVRWDPNNGTRQITFDRLGTGLHNVPDFVACTTTHCGTDQVMTRQCVAQDGERCTSGGVWISERGDSDSVTKFHSMGGECYLDGKLVDDGIPRGQEACDAAVEVNVKRFQRAHLITSCIFGVGFNPNCSDTVKQPRSSIRSMGWGISGPGYLKTMFQPCAGVLDNLNPARGRTCDHYAQGSYAFEADEEESKNGCYPPPIVKVILTTEDEEGNKTKHSQMGPPYGCVPSGGGEYMACRDVIDDCVKRQSPVQDADRTVRPENLRYSFVPPE